MADDADHRAATDALVAWFADLDAGRVEEAWARTGHTARLTLALAQWSEEQPSGEERDAERDMVVVDLADHGPLAPGWDDFVAWWRGAFGAPPGTLDPRALDVTPAPTPGELRVAVTDPASGGDVVFEMARHDDGWRVVGVFADLEWSSATLRARAAAARRRRARRR